MDQDLIDLTPLWREYERFACPGATRHDALVSVLQDSWSESTVVPHLKAEWRPLRPQYGQDDVTALLVQRLCGGDILVLERHGVKHFYNRLPLGEGYVDDDLVFPMDTLLPEREMAKVINNADFFRFAEDFAYHNGDEIKVGTALRQRYAALHDRAHFVMARVIR